jgi:hypothetical protein
MSDDTGHQASRKSKKSNTSDDSSSFLFLIIIIIVVTIFGVSCCQSGFPSLSIPLLYSRIDKVDGKYLKADKSNSKTDSPIETITEAPRSGKNKVRFSSRRVEIHYGKSTGKYIDTVKGKT